MKKLPFFLCAFLIVSITHAQHSKAVKDYIEAYKDIAIDEMIRTGVPASITLAQGIHESNAGQSVLVKKSNNHFGIKCKTEWKGEWVSHDDDAKGECFRKYDDPFESYRDHSDFLKNRAHYASLFKLDPTDYEGWAYGLKKAGYATNPKYPQVLIKLVKDYNLQEYSLMALQKDEREPEVILASNTARYTNESSSPAMAVEIVAAKPAYPSGVFKINETKVMYVLEGTSYLKIAEEHQISLSKLFEFNEMKAADLAEYDHLLFLQRKRKQGTAEFHTVAKGEDLHAIAQLHGMRLESLLEFNHLQPGAALQAGTKLHLKNSAPSPLSKFISGVTSSDDAKSKKSAEPKAEWHTVQAKETMYSIARKYDISVDDLKKWNKLESNELKIGQELRINK